MIRNDKIDKKMANKIMKKSLKKIGLASMLFGAVALGSGCAEFYDDPLNRAVFGTMQELSPEFLQSSGWKEYKEQKKDEKERYRRMTEEVQRERAERARIEWEQNRIPKLIVYNKWEDLDHNGKVNDEELDGLGKTVFDLSKEEMNVAIDSRGYEGKIVFKTWSSKNKLVGETLMYAPKNKLSGAITGPGKPNEGDFLDNLKGAGPGDYVITATLDNGRELYLPLKIIGAKKGRGTKPTYNSLERKSSATEGFRDYSPKKAGTIKEETLYK